MSKPEIVAFLMRQDFYGPYVSLHRDSNCDGTVDPLVRMADYDALLAERDALKAGLGHAAQSLETISRLAGKDEFMQDMTEVRGFANSRAIAAFAAMQGEQK